MVWLGSRAKDILVLCDYGLKTSPPRSPFAKSGYKDGVSSSLAQLAANIRLSIPGAPPLSRMHREIQDLTKRMKTPSPENIFFELMCLIYGMRSTGQECLNINCSFITEEFLRPLKLCAGCRIIPYCSKECQVAGWKNPICPHKGVCKDLHEFDFILDELKDGALRTSAKKCVERGMSVHLTVDLVMQLTSLRSKKTSATGQTGGR